MAHERPITDIITDQNAPERAPITVPGSPEGESIPEAFLTPEGIPITSAYWLSSDAKQLLEGVVSSINTHGELPEPRDRPNYHGGYSPSDEWSLLLEFATSYSLEHGKTYYDKPVYTPHFLELHHTGNISNGVAIKNYTGAVEPNQWQDHEYRFETLSLKRDIALKLEQHGIEWVEERLVF